jgi:N-dimethylarginine dimethylaminohydrolase
MILTRKVKKIKKFYSDINVPCFLMDAPQNYSANNANNIWMKDLKDSERKIDKPKALKEWLNLYNYISSESYVITLPEFPVDLQDQVFVANLGIMLHTGDFIVSNFTSPPRKQESYYGMKFFKLFLPDAVICPYKWEGEAELKYLHDNIYIGGYGQRSDIKSYLWMQKTYPVEIIPVFMKDEYCYHLDCMIFPLTKEKTFVCTRLLTKAEVRSIAKVTDIIDVSIDDARQGVCNNVRLGNLILNAYCENEEDNKEIRELKKHKNYSLENICKDNGFEPVYFNLQEYEKGGAALSCMILHINRLSYQTQLL